MHYSRSDGAGIVVLPSAKEAKGPRSAEEEAEARPLSKAEQRKLKQVQAKKERREGLAAVRD